MELEKTASGHLKVSPDCLSSYGGVLVVVLRDVEDGHAKPKVAKVASSDNVPVNCYKSADAENAAGKDFIRKWTTVCDKNTMNDYKIEVSLGEHSSNSALSKEEISIALRDSKGHLVSSCILKKVSVEEALQIFLEERIQDKKTIQEQQSSLKKLIIEKNLMEDTMYRAFAKCLNSKKAKISELQERLRSSSPGGAIAIPKPVKSKANVKLSKLPSTRKSKRNLNKFDSNPSPSQSDDHDSSPAGESPNLLKSNPSNATAKELYNFDTDTDEEIAGPSKAIKPSHKVLIIESSSSGSETDYDGDAVPIVDTGKNPKPAKTNQTNEKNNNDTGGNGPSPPKQAKKADSDSDRYNIDLLLDDL